MEDAKVSFQDKIEAARFTSKENIVSLFIVVMTLFFHLVFTMALHAVPEV